MDAALRIHQTRQGIEIGGAHLLQLAVLQDAVHHRMLPGQFLQGLLTGGCLAALGLARCGQAQPVEQHVAQLLGRADVELRARQLVDMGCELVQLPLHVVEESPEGRGVDGHPALLHACQHGQQGHLQPPEQLQKTVFFHALPEQPRHGQPQACGAGGRLAPALQLMPQHGAPAGRKAGPAVIVLFGIQQIGGHAQVDAVRRASGQEVPAGRGGQHALEIGRHQSASRGQPAGQSSHGACPLPFAQRASASILHGKIGSLPVSVGPDQGHAGPPAVRQGRYVIQRGRGLLRHGVQKAHLADGTTTAGRLGQRQGGS